MKKLIGIILAVCMLSTMAFAATATYSNEVADMETMTVTVNYGGIAEGAQATLLAYDVTGVVGATAATAYVNEATTPIKGIDQEAVDGTFSFKVADTYRGTLVVKIGGTDVDPVAFTVEFKDAPSEPEGVTILFGDIDGNGTVSAADGVAIINSTYNGQKTFKGYTIGVAVIDGGTTLFGDIDGNGTISAADGVAIINSTYNGQKTYKDYTIGVDATITK